jgi:hypothetical protein
MQETQARRRRLVVTLLVLLFLLAGAAAVGSLFTRSLTTAEQLHDHDGDGKPDH